MVLDERMFMVLSEKIHVTTNINIPRHQYIRAHFMPCAQFQSRAEFIFNELVIDLKVNHTHYSDDCTRLGVP